MTVDNSAIILLTTIKVSNNSKLANVQSLHYMRYRTLFSSVVIISGSYDERP